MLYCLSYKHQQQTQRSEQSSIVGGVYTMHDITKYAPALSARARAGQPLKCAPILLFSWIRLRSWYLIVPPLHINFARHKLKKNSDQVFLATLGCAIPQSLSTVAMVSSYEYAGDTFSHPRTLCVRFTSALLFKMSSSTRSLLP